MKIKAEAPAVLLPVAGKKGHHSSRESINILHHSRQAAGTELGAVGRCVGQVFSCLVCSPQTQEGKLLIPKDIHSLL